MPWNYVDIIIDPESASFIGDYKCGPGDFKTKEDASHAFHKHLNIMYRNYRGTPMASSLKKLRSAWEHREGNVAQSNRVVLAIYEHPAGRGEEYALMMSMLVNRLCKVNRLKLLAGHVSFWAVGELLKRYPDIQVLCGKLETSR